jgi:hypothetical protein
MPEMRVRPVSPAVAVLLLVSGVLIAVGCVPRPVGPESPATTPVGAPSAASRSGATLPPGPVGPTPVPSFSRPTPLPAPTFLAYAVKNGDTLTSIAREFHTTPRSIAFWSRREHPSLDPESAAYEPDRLEVGWILLVIPDAVFDEDELMDTTPSPPPSPAPGATTSPAPSATAG